MIGPQGAEGNRKDFVPRIADGIRRSALLLIALIAVVILGTQVAIAGQDGSAETATHGKRHSKSSKIQLRELRALLEAQGAQLQTLRTQLAVLQGQSGSPAVPTGAAAGDLTGSYPGPQIAPGVITAAHVNPLNVDGAAATPSLRSLGTGGGQALPGNQAAGGDLTGAFPNPTLTGGSIESTSLFTASLLNGAAATPTLRSLGTGATQAMPGNATPGGTPTGTAGGDLDGSYPNPTIDGGAVGAAALGSVSLRSASFDAPDGAVTTETLACAAGEQLLSGGASLLAAAQVTDLQIISDSPNSNVEWGVTIANTGGLNGTIGFQIRILCLNP